MENALFANVKKLYDHKLYECVIPLAKLLITVLKNDRNVATLELEYQVQLYLVNSLYKERHLRSASRHFEDLFQQRRPMIRHKQACLAAIESAYPEFGDLELRRRAAECYREIGNTGMAVATLLQVPVKSRTPRINLMLARLQHHCFGVGYTKKTDSLPAYKEVIRECPMALSVIQDLLELGENGNEVNSLVMHAASVPGNFDWLSTWIKALAQMFDCKHQDAARTFQRLQDSTLLRCNEQLMMALGRCLYYDGSYAQAEQFFAATVAANPENIEAIGLLAVVRGHDSYNSNSNSTDMERLYGQVTAEQKYTANHWFVHAQSMYDAGKFERGLSFVGQCLSAEPRHQEALILRGRLLISLERFLEAVEAFRTAQTVAPYRFEAYRGLFHSYLAAKRFKEAHAMCNWTLRVFQNSPRGLTMFGRTLFHSPEPQTKKTARKFAEKSLKIDPNYTPAVTLMADIFQLEGDFKASIKLLEDHVSLFPHANLFTSLADMLRTQKEPLRALEYYYKALGKNPKCERTLRGISLLKSSNSLIGGGTTVLDESGPPPPPIKVVVISLTSNGPPPLAATPCGTANLDGWMENSREATSSPAARSGQDVDGDGDGDGAVWHDVDAEMVNMNYDGH